MPLFFSRRLYNSKTDKFTNGPSKDVRYVSVKDKTPGQKGWAGSVVTQKKWLGLVKKEGMRDGIVIFVHGFNTEQAEMLERMQKIEMGLKRNGFQGAVVAFDWPSDGRLLNYNNDRDDAKYVAASLVRDGVVPLMGMSPRPKIHVLAHSMGSLVTGRGFQQFGDTAGPGGGNWGVEQICCVAADVEAQEMAKGSGTALVLAKRSRRMTNYYSDRDRVLRLSGKFINGGRSRLGRIGMPQLVEKGHYDVDAEAQYRRDVYPSDKSARYSHTWWFDNDGFYKDLAQTLRGKSAGSMTTRRGGGAGADQELWT